MAGYLVTESVPLAYDRRTWPDGERSPGVKQITMFDKRSDIDDAQFFARWHGSHTPLTFEVHPVCLYVRHAVARRDREARRLARIVEEGLRDVEDLTDPMRYFSAGGSPTRSSTTSSASWTTSRHSSTSARSSHPTAEYILRSLRPDGSFVSALEGKAALVTGGGSGLGRASAIALARASATVTVADVDEQGGRRPPPSCSKRRAATPTSSAPTSRRPTR